MKKLFRWKLIKKLDKYIIVKFLGTYVFAIALIISIAVVFDINEKMDKFMTNDAPLKAIIFDYYMNFVPYFANLCLHCCYLFYFQNGGEFGDYRHVLYRNEL